jgi:addiction module HigA family antidote
VTTGDEWPPGDTLADLLDERGITQAELAERMGRPLKTVNEIVKGKAAITPETAIQLETTLGTPAEFWLNREGRYREWLAREEKAAVGVDVADVELRVDPGSAPDDVAHGAMLPKVLDT